MKAYMDIKKDKKIKDSNDVMVHYGITVYDDANFIVFSTKSSQLNIEDARFMHAVKSFLWGIKKVKSIEERGLIKGDKLDIIINNKMLYTWLGAEDKEIPDAYKNVISDILFEISFIVPKIEVILSSCSNKVLFKDTSKESKLERVTDYFNNI